MKRLEYVSIILYNSALTQLHERNITKALELLEKAYLINNNNIEIINLLGLCNYIRCDFGKAKFYWEKSYEKEPINNRAGEYIKILNSEEFNTMLNNYNKALEHLQSNELNLALKNLKKVLRYDNKFVEPNVIMGLIYFKKDLYSLSEKKFKIAIRFDRGNIRIKEYYLELIRIKSMKKSKN